MEKDNICEKCRFWHQTGATDDGLLGECHCKPPLPDLSSAPADSKMRFAVWPSTLQHHWCGAFEEKPMDQSEVMKRVAVIEQMEAERRARKK